MQVVSSVVSILAVPALLAFVVWQATTVAQLSVYQENDPAYQRKKRATGYLESKIDALDKKLDTLDKKLDELKGIPRA